MVHVVMNVAFDLAVTQASAVNDAGMVILVKNHIIAAPNNCTDRTQIGLHAGREHQRSLFADPFSQLTFELVVQRERSVEEAGARAAGAITVDGLAGSLFDTRVGGQTKVIIRPAHDQTLPVVNDFCSFVFIQGYKVWVHTLRHGLFGLRKF